MIEVPLTQGKFALIDDEDAELVGAYRWHAFRIHRCWYAAASVNGRRLYMHRLITGNVPGDVDHINHDGLDNRRTNLRTAQRRGLNIANARFRPGMTGFRGVTMKPSWQRHHVNPYIAQIKVLGKRIALGNYATAEEAAKAYDEAARRHFGEFAITNFSGN